MDAVVAAADSMPPRDYTDSDNPRRQRPSPQVDLAFASGLVWTRTLGVPVHAVLCQEPRDSVQAVVGHLLASMPTDALVTFANPGTALLARRSAAFRQDLDAFDVVLPDGLGMCLAIKRLHSLPARRVSFDMTSLAPAIFDVARRDGLSMVLVGGAPGVAEQARGRILGNYPGLTISGTFDGYGDDVATIGQIALLRPDIVICGMGGVKQETFLLRLRDQGWRGWGFTCGGFLDQLQLAMNYYPRWVDRANLRWAYRIVREPGRLWRRYLVDYSQFGFLLCAALTRKHRYAQTSS